MALKAVLIHCMVLTNAHKERGKQKKAINLQFYYPNMKKIHAYIISNLIFHVRLWIMIP